MYNNFMQSTGIALVQGIEGAKAFQLLPNSNAILMDSEQDDIFYIKVCDSFGMPNIRTFRYEEITKKLAEPKHDEFITRDEFYKALEELKHEHSVQQPVPESE